MQVVWFKRDLRVEDHAALVQAASKGAVLPLYILEPELWEQSDLSERHYHFLIDCLADLDKALEVLGQPLIIRVGDAVKVFESLAKEYQINALWSHQETWNGWTYQRDLAVKQWAYENTIDWHEPSQNGVIRRLADRDGWAARWYKAMQQSTAPAPNALKPLDIVSDTMPNVSQLGLENDGCTMPQKGGRHEGLRLLHSFLNERGELYTKEMSSPLSAYDSCSRLSPHLAFGTLSIREVFKACEARTQDIKEMPYGSKGKWPSAMRSFSGRLRWHCHFMQKLEDEPRIEFENMHPSYDGLRENDFNEAYFTAWKSGKTGYPMIDACMRALTATGWLNFRMRAMLMSFASYHLWLHWRKPALHLAQLFTDYEPGIHYSQVQMQSGTTGINSIRIYNPVKQGIDHDPDGIFIRQWIPELVNMPQEYIHTPWQAPAKMQDYPMPIVNEKAARKAAAEKVYGLRKDAKHRTEARKIVSKHGSRKSGLSSSARRKPKKTTRPDSKQTELLL